MPPEILNTILWVILAICFGAWLAVSWVLSYHWRSYSKDSPIIKRASRAYYSVSLLVFIGMALLIVSL